MPHPMGVNTPKIRERRRGGMRLVTKKNLCDVVKKKDLRREHIYDIENKKISIKAEVY